MRGSGGSANSLRRKARRRSIVRQGPTARVVGRKEYDEAVVYLRAHGGLDVDAFLAKAGANLLDEPMGPTPECLSVNQIGDHVAHRAGETARSLDTHLAGCADCRANVGLYRSLEESEPFRIEDSAPVTVSEGKRGSLELILVSMAAPATAIEPKSLVVKGGLGYRRETRCLSIRKLDEPKRFGGRAAFAARFPHAGRYFSGTKAGVSDYLEVKGKTTDGTPFQVRGLLNFRRGGPGKP